MTEIKSYTNAPDQPPASISGAKYHAKRSIISWGLYDWANSAFATVIITFIYSVYFTNGIVQDELKGGVYWSYAIGISGIVIAILGPVLGAMADHSRRRKWWVFFFSLVCIAASACLIFVKPDPAFSNVLLALMLVGIANVGFEIAQIFYNAMLPHIAPSHMLGRVSGWGWALGYGGGLACLAFVLYGMVGVGETEPFLNITGAESLNIRASGPVVALWFFIFMLPMMLFTRDYEVEKLSFAKAFQSGLKQLKETAIEIRSHGNLMRFLIASALYRDGLVTLFAIGGIYAHARYGMNLQDILFFAIYLNISAGIGAFLFAHVDDWIGSRMTVILGLFGLIISGLMILMTASQDGFMMLAIVLGIFIGPVQAASRTLAGRLSPAGMENQTFGFYAFTGKSVAFLGPLAYGFFSDMTGSQQFGLLSIVFFWLAGLLVLLTVREK